MKTLDRRSCFIIATGVTSALLLGCGSSSTSESEGTDAPSAFGIYGKTENSTAEMPDSNSQIMIASSSFTISGNVNSSDVVSVANHDSFKHTITSDDGVFDVTVESGATESLPALTPGTYAFHCKIHPSMQGTLTVV